MKQHIETRKLTRYEKNEILKDEIGNKIINLQSDVDEAKEFIKAIKEDEIDELFLEYKGKRMKISLSTVQGQLKDFLEKEDQLSKRFYLLGQELEKNKEIKNKQKKTKKQRKNDYINNKKL